MQGHVVPAYSARDQLAANVISIIQAIANIDT